MSEESLQNEQLEEDVVTEEAVETTESVEEITPEEVIEDKHQSRNQNAKQRLKRKLREEADKNTQLTSDLTALKEQVDGLINPPAQRPSRVEFETEEDYEDALYDYRKPAPVEQPVAQPQQHSQPQVDYEAEEKWEAQVDATEDKYDDFQEVINNPEVPITTPMADAIKSAESGDEVAYFLGKNPAEADKIARMSPVMQIRAIDKLSNEFKPKTTTAPDPINPIDSADSNNKPKKDPLIDGATFT